MARERRPDRLHWLSEGNGVLFRSGQWREKENGGKKGKRQVVNNAASLIYSASIGGQRNTNWETLTDFEDESGRAN